MNFPATKKAIIPSESILRIDDDARLEYTNQVFPKLEKLSGPENTTQLIDRLFFNEEDGKEDDDGLLLENLKT